MFKNESGVRQWMKQLLGKDNLFWHEAAAGGTSGYPDCEWAHEELLTPIELKCDTLQNHRGLLWYVPKLRPPQMEVARRLAKLGVCSFIVVGEDGGDAVGLGLLAVAEEAQRAGTGTLLRPIESVQKWHSDTADLRCSFAAIHRGKPRA